MGKGGKDKGREGRIEKLEREVRGEIERKRRNTGSEEVG